MVDEKIRELLEYANGHISVAMKYGPESAKLAILRAICKLQQALTEIQESEDDY